MHGDRSSGSCMSVGFHSWPCEESLCQGAVGWGAATGVPRRAASNSCCARTAMPCSKWGSAWLSCGSSPSVKACVGCAILPSKCLVIRSPSMRPALVRACDSSTTVGLALIVAASSAGIARCRSCLRPTPTRTPRASCLRPKSVMPVAMGFRAVSMVWSQFWSVSKRSVPYNCKKCCTFTFT